MIPDQEEQMLRRQAGARLGLRDARAPRSRRTCFYLAHHSTEGAPVCSQRLCASLRDQYLTSSAAEAVTEEVSEPGTV
jgi:hypothetical protein